MNAIIGIYNFIHQNWSVIATAIATLTTAGWAICEVLARIPGVKANSTFQWIYNLINNAKNNIPTPPTTPAATV